MTIKHKCNAAAHEDAWKKTIKYRNVKYIKLVNFYVDVQGSSNSMYNLDVHTCMRDMPAIWYVGYALINLAHFEFNLIYICVYRCIWVGRVKRVHASGVP